MTIGYFLLVLALLATLFSGWQYFSLTRKTVKQTRGTKKSRKEREKREKELRFARLGFYLMTIFVSLASGYLLYLILSHQFQYSYVYRHSSNALPIGYLISAFWAGQEGSFLLWIFMIALMGLIFIKIAKEYELYGMFVVNIIQGFFLLILLKASPFQLLPQTPTDGAGLNPLLQNPWMVIHPPVLFLGYAAITFPFAIALAALVKRDYTQFISRALPWTLFASLTLGAGIIIGGYWAYVTLGWGGYWGWDPVENSSLVPWLTVLALTHGLIVQKIKGSLQRTNFFLAIISLILVIYATFLTRSGVLADFSVHSFQDEGINLYLILFMLTVVGISAYAFGKRFREIPRQPIDFSAPNRENILLGSIYVFCISALFIFLGTSSPLITGIFENPSQVGIEFYNQVHIPIAILLGLLLGFAPYLRWHEEGISAILKQVIPSIVLTVLTTVLLIWIGIRAPKHIVFVAAASFGLWSNLLVLFQRIRLGWQLISAPLTHVGVGFLLLGIILSGALEQKQKVALTQDVPTNAFGYQMVYKGMAKAPNGKDMMKIAVKSGNTKFEATPHFYYSNYNQAMMAEPAVKSTIGYDLYISPLERRPAIARSEEKRRLILKKGEVKKYGDYEFHFKNFNMSTHAEGGDMQVGADIEVRKGKEAYSIVPAIILDQNGKKNVPGTFMIKTGQSETQARVILNRIDADAKVIELFVHGIDQGSDTESTHSERVYIEVTRKPFMSILWLGCLLIIFGSGFAVAHRYQFLLQRNTTN